MQTANFGTTSTGAVVQAVTIAAGDLSATILTLGCTLQCVRLNGVPYSLTLGSDLVSDYEASMLYFGAVVGPVANRITKAAASLNGRALQFTANENGNLLHGGGKGLHSNIWSIAALSPDSVTLALTLAQDEGGLPGTRHIRATFQIDAPATLRLTLSADTDAPTLLNLANHSYWNLDGTATWQGHSLQIAADNTLPVDASLLPTGTIAPVTDTPFDFRTLRLLVAGEPALDTNFCLSNGKTAIRPVACLKGASGLTMILATTEPGLQVYDAQRTSRPGRSTYEGLAIEAQGWPDAPNHANFPSVQITPDAPYAQTTEWRFTKR